MRINPTAAAGYAQVSVDTDFAALRVGRAYMNVASAPTTNRVFSPHFRFVSALRVVGLAYNTADAKWYPAEDDGTTCTLGSAGVELAAGWHCIDLKVNVVANPWTIDVQVDGVALPQLTRALAADNIQASLLVGNRTATTVTADAYFDDVWASVTEADYPYGPGKVLSFVPNADGTHTATGTNITDGTIATPVGAAITSARTDVFNWVNARPLGGGATDITRLINQQTLLTTQYVEVDFEPTTEPNPPRAVDVFTVDRQAATQSGGFSVKLNDNGTEDVIITRSGAGVVTDRYFVKQYATMVGGGAWTLARFNALKARFGYSSDATPDQYWRGIMIEAEFPPTPVLDSDDWMNQGVFQSQMADIY